MADKHYGTDRRGPKDRPEEINTESVGCVRLGCVPSLHRQAVSSWPHAHRNLPSGKVQKLICGISRVCVWTLGTLSHSPRLGRVGGGGLQAEGTAPGPLQLLLTSHPGASQARAW